MTKANKVLSLAAAFSLLAVASVYAQSTKTNPINGSDPKMTHATALLIEHDIFALSKKYPQIPGNIARMSAECAAVNQNTGMCQVYDDLTREHEWRSSGGQLL